MGFACHLVGYDFPGRDALLRIQSQPRKVGSHRVGNVGQAGRPAGLRDHWPATGRRTKSPAAAIRPRSANRSPWATLPPEFAQPGGELQVDVRGRREPARVVELPVLSPQEERKPTIMPMSAYKSLLYSKTHEWVRVESDPAGGKTATVGLTAFALEAANRPGLHRVAARSVPAVKAGQPFGEIESVKAVSDLYSPVDGEVAAVNAAIAEQPRTPGRRSVRDRLVDQDQDHQRSRPGRPARRSGVQESSVKKNNTERIRQGTRTKSYGPDDTIAVESRAGTRGSRWVLGSTSLHCRPRSY